MSAPLSSVWNIVEYRGREGLERIEQDWRRLYGEMPNPGMCHSFEAYRVYLEHLSPSPERSRCLALSDGARIRAIFPLEERIEHALGFSQRVWGLPSHGEWTPTDAIGPEDDARRALLPAVVDHLRQQPDRPALLVVGQTSAASVLWDGCRDLSAADRYTFTDGGTYHIPTSAPLDGPETEQMSRKSFRHIKAADKRFRALPGAHYVCARGPAELSVEFEHFLEVESSGWKGEQGTAVRQKPKLVAFYRALLSELENDGRCMINSLHVGDRCIASALIVQTGRQCVSPKIGYDEEYMMVSPGRLAAQKTIDLCREDPDIDFLDCGSKAEWIQAWHPESHDLLRSYIALRAMPGRGLLLALRCRFGPMRHAVRTVRSWQAGRARRQHRH